MNIFIVRRKLLHRKRTLDKKFEQITCNNNKITPKEQIENLRA